MPSSTKKRQPDCLENNSIKRIRTEEKSDDVKQETIEEIENTTSDEDYNEESDSDYEEEFNLESELEKLMKQDPTIFKKLKDVTSELEKSEPSVVSLFETSLRIEDRAKLCQYYEIYKTQEPNTYEWLESRIRYNKMLEEYKINFNQYNKFSKEEHSKMDEEEKRLCDCNTQMSLKYKILNLETSDSNKSVIYRKYEELQNLDFSNDEYGKLKHWIKWATEIPHDKMKDIKVKNITEFIEKASKKLDDALFGMENVKEQILLFLSAKLYNPKNKKNNLGLIGPPGVGKTAIARLISEIMDWGFEQISFGGADKADFLKGHEYTYVGAQPGEIVKCLKKMGHKNGVIFLDELDKISDNPEIRAALLHLVDKSQNSEFKDNFLGELTIDLSNIWFVSSMNKLPRDKALADRWWIIKVDGYNNKEKVTIVQKYIIPKALKNIGLEENSISFDDKTVSYLIETVCETYDKGVRTIEKYINDLLNKIHFINIHQNENGVIPFKTSFSPNIKIKYPMKFDTELIKHFSEDKQINYMINMMYI
jgi:ATP-dependent Lon protease